MSLIIKTTTAKIIATIKTIKNNIIGLLLKKLFFMGLGDESRELFNEAKFSSISFKLSVELLLVLVAVG